MRTHRRSTIPLFLAAALVFAGACDNDGGGVTGPVTNAEPPSVVLTSAPASGQADHELTFEFTVTDDVALEVVTVDWGTPGTPVETIPVSGKSFSGSYAHTFAVAGQFTIEVQVRDASGQQSSVTHEVSIAEPPPAAPTNLAVTVDEPGASVSWTPGAWGASQEVVLSRVDAVEPVRVQFLAGNENTSIAFTDLAWDASYTVVVAAVNSAGRAESAPAAFQTRIPDPPSLTRFSAAAADPTCLVLEWTAAEVAENLRVVVTGDTEGDSFEELLPAVATDVEFCAAVYPIADGMTYTSQVFSELGGMEYGSNTLEFTADFNPSFTATGAWTGTWQNVLGSVIRLDLQLDNVEGDITGQWAEFFDADGEPLGSGPVSGTRVWGVVELTLLEFGLPEAGAILSGEFVDANTIDGVLDIGFAAIPITMQRD